MFDRKVGSPSSSGVQLGLCGGRNRLITFSQINSRRNAKKGVMSSAASVSHKNLPQEFATRSPFFWPILQKNDSGNELKLEFSNNRNTRKCCFEWGDKIRSKERYNRQNAAKLCDAAQKGGCIYAIFPSREQEKKPASLAWFTKKGF